MSAATSTALGPVLVCRDCCEGFAWDSSPDPDRYLRCAAARAWHEGFTDITDQASRLSAGHVLREA